MCPPVLFSPVLFSPVLFSPVLFSPVLFSMTASAPPVWMPSSKYGSKTSAKGAS